VTDGAAGHEAQAIAVAEAVGLPFSLRRVRAKGAMRLLPPALQIYLPPKLLLSFIDANAPIEPPWPRLIISSGGRSVPIALAVKRLSDPPAFALHIHDPKVRPGRFDLVAAHVHDRLAGDNVITTLGAVHSVTPERVTREMAAFAGRIDPLPRPRIAVLLGGDSRAFSFSPAEAAKFGRELAELARKEGASLLVTPSHRTSPESLAALLAKIEGVPHLAWDGTGANPYFAFLGYADFIVVTQDSINMVTEAAGTGKPVYVRCLPGYSRRQSRFHAVMREKGVTRPFDGRLATWSYAPVNDTEAVAAPIRRALGLDRA
jgi:uncharacterized protein